MSDSEETKSLTASKLVIALVLFVGLGFLINTFLSYNQGSTTIQTLEERAVVGDASLELNKQQSADLKILIEKMEKLESKLENLEKTGKSIK